jgi:diacylglycerol O-acyltransferase
VLAAAVAGALASYLEGRGEVPADLTTMVPVNLRPAGEPLPAELGNRFALVLLKLPIGVRGPLARVGEAKRRMDTIKASPEAAMTFAMIQAIGRTNPDLARLLVNFFADKAIGVTTNVVGPPHARYLAGERIAGMLGWVPGSGRQTVGVCVLSYQGTVRIGFKVDAGVVPDPHHLVDALDNELDELLRIARAA